MFTICQDEEEWKDFCHSIYNITFPNCIVSLPSKINALRLLSEKTSIDEEVNINLHNSKTDTLCYNSKVIIEYSASFNIMELYIVRCVNSNTQYLVNAQDLKINTIPFGISLFSTPGTYWFKSLPDQNSEIYYQMLQLVKAHLEHVNKYTIQIDNNPFIPFTPKAQFFVTHNGQTVIGVLGVNKYGRNCIGYYKDLVLLPESFESLLANMATKKGILLNTRTSAITSTTNLISIDQHTIFVDTDVEVDYKKVDAFKQLLTIIEQNTDLLDLFKRIINNYPRT